jgi:ABC-type lipoprotein export system ATPase subunit
LGPHLINVRQLRKVYKTPTGDVPALKDIDVEVAPGEFVGVIGKSGSGKTTFINMLTGIDRPTSGAVLIGETLVHSLGEDDLAAWRGHNLGIVFQFFQLLPTLSLIENVMLPMDINRMYSQAQRRSRARELLDLVGMAEYGHKLPADVSGGQQQRAAIARALANNPPLLIADEPTGNLDSKSANQIFELFQKLAAGGTTILMVTHDDDLIKRVDRTIAIHDGEVVNEYLARSHGPSDDYRAEVQGQGRRVAYSPGATVTRHGERGQEFFIVLEGKVQVLLPQPGGRELLVGELGPGQYFGEAALLGHTPYPTTVRAAPEGGATLAVFDADTFHEAVSRSARLRAD